MKLISMIYFVLEQLGTKQSSSEFKEVVKNYASFLKQPLTLGMFVPCDNEGNVLEEPQTEFKYLKGSTGEDIQKEYQKAKERVLFDGFGTRINNTSAVQLTNAEKSSIFFFHERSLFYVMGDEYCKKKIEDLISYGPTLTESAIKQLGL